MKDLVLERYLNGDYLKNNPDWISHDSDWKAQNVLKLLEDNFFQPQTICDVSCGSGKVLETIRKSNPSVGLTGYDISPDAKLFWDRLQQNDITFKAGDFLILNNEKFDLILLLDVLEHIADPHKFLSDIKEKANYLVIHFPLDLSVISVLRESPLLYVRRKVGHIHYFTKGLALELLNECGFEIISHQYTNAYSSTPERSIKTKLFGIVRSFFSLFGQDFGAKLLGGQTLMVLVKVNLQ